MYHHFAPRSSSTGCNILVKEHSWGGDAAPLQPPFDVVCAADVMYVAEAVQPLLASLVAVAGPGTEVLIAHGRNRQVAGWLPSLVCVSLWIVTPSMRYALHRAIATAEYPAAWVFPALPLALQAEPEFLKGAERHFTIQAVPSSELDEVYQCTDVDVLRLTLKTSRTSASSGGCPCPTSPLSAIHRPSHPPCFASNNVQWLDRVSPRVGRATCRSEPQSSAPLL